MMAITIAQKHGVAHHKPIRSPFLYLSALIQSFIVHALNPFPVAAAHFHIAAKDERIIRNSHPKSVGSTSELQSGQRVL